MRKLSITFCLALIAYNLFAQDADNILLKNYRPVSIYKTPTANIQRASFPVIDMHSHDYVETKNDVDDLVKLMDKMNIKKTMILTYATGKGFDSAVEKYSKYPDRFELFCGFDYTGYGTPGWQKHAVEELERCYKKGARGVGELGDKGEGELYSKPTPGKGLHIDDPQLKPLLEKCAELHIPISIHVAEDEWMYETPDSTNDGLMNAATWHVDMNKPNKLGHDELQKSLENAVRENPKTIFIACHLLNACSNLQVLGDMLDKYPNLYADIAARFGEFAPVPRYAAAFFTKYQDRLVYGTDNGPDEHMYLTTFRILETADEHFYEQDTFNYHWALYGLNLPKEVLEKLYYKNAEKILNLK
jgi:predicted TIM-barrel fold metal-dependent hydrolase